MSARAPDVELRVEDPAGADGRRLRRAFWVDVAALVGIPLDADGLPPGDESDLVPPGGAFVVARLRGAAAGCVGVRRLEPGVHEVKRLYVDPAARGARLGAVLLAAAEDLVRAQGGRVVRLDTRSELVAARRLYEAAGYVEVAPYNDNPHAQLWFEKQLP